jgi:hypothetical protein
VLAVAVLRKDKTRKISSLRLFVQIAFVILIFIGIFINMPRLPLIPNSEIAQHEYLVGTDLVNGPLPDGLPIPAFACYYACGRTVICPLWQIQTYIYPFWNTGHGWAVNYDTSGLVRIALVFAAIIVAAVVLGRFFCGWICRWRNHEKSQVKNVSESQLHDTELIKWEDEFWRSFYGN